MRETHPQTAPVLFDAHLHLSERYVRKLRILRMWFSQSCAQFRRGTRKARLRGSTVQRSSLPLPSNLKLSTSFKFPRDFSLRKWKQLDSDREYPMPEQVS